MHIFLLKKPNSLSWNVSLRECMSATLIVDSSSVYRSIPSVLYPALLKAWTSAASLAPTQRIFWASGENNAPFIDLSWFQLRSIWPSFESRRITDPSDKPNKILLFEANLHLNLYSSLTLQPYTLIELRIT